MVMSKQNIGEISSRKGFFKYMRKPIEPESIVLAKLMNEPFEFDGHKFSRGYMVVDQCGKLAAMSFDDFIFKYEILKFG